MDSDSYKIIISISHHRIAFEYWQRDGENKLIPFPNGNWPAPLAFYCSPTGIIIGEEAQRAAHAGILNSYTDYFSHLSDAETCSVGGQTRPVRNLLLEAIECVLNDFYRNVLIRFGSLSDNRASMPLTIACESDVRPHERALIAGMLHDSGYGRAMVVEYDSYIYRYIRDSLSQKYPCKKVLVAWAEDSDLIFTLFDVTGKSEKISVTLKNLGIDPRKDYVKRLIWERVQGQNPWLSYQEEEESIDKAALDFLNSDKPMINDTIRLSDGVDYHYSLSRNSINFYKGTEGQSLQQRLDDFLREVKAENKNDILLLLRGNAAGNSYFEENLRQGFFNLLRTDKRLRENTMRLLIEEKNPPAGKSALSPMPPTPPTPPPPPESSTDDITDSNISKSLKREWRSIKAEANGKIRSGKTEEAKILLNDFIEKCRQARYVELENDVLVEINKIKPEKKVNGGEKPHTTTSDSGKSSKPNRNEQDSREKEKPNTVSEGKKLASLGKLKEARDWYRNNGDTAKARLMSDIIRARKSVESRKSGLEECRKNPDKTKINRIIQELEDYLDLCEKGAVPCPEYRSLISEYKKIK
ncbi:MAG: hypothetical protein HDS95_01845 [Bacteroidales bacterium]|nr:hypothetical protein [Bacteroidales bacterium]